MIDYKNGYFLVFSSLFSSVCGKDNKSDTVPVLRPLRGRRHHSMIVFREEALDITVSSSLSTHHRFIIVQCC